MGQITLASDLSSLPKGRAFIKEACQSLSIDQETTYDILLAVDEVLSNLIEHGYAGLEPGDIILNWYEEDGRFVAQITDFGRVFTPVEPEKPDIQEIFDRGKQGGVGLYLVYQFMDEISYQSSADGNTLTLVKDLTKE